MDAKAPLLRKEGSLETPIHRIIGEPEDLDGARQLATEDRYRLCQCQACDIAGLFFGSVCKKPGGASEVL